MLGRLLTCAVRVHASGPVAATTAWQRYSYLGLWPGWAPQVRAVQCPVDVVTAGAQGRVVGPGGLSAGFTVLEVDEAGRSWAWRVRRGPLVILGQHGIEALPGDGCRAWMRLTGPVPVVLTYPPAAWVALHRLVTLATVAGEPGHESR